MGKLEPRTASREHTPFPPDRAGGPTGCLDPCGNPQKSRDSSVSDEPQRFSTLLLEEALTPENRSRTVRPALRLTRGWKHGRRETRAPATHAPSNRSRKRFRFPAPLGSGPFRGPFFCALVPGLPASRTSSRL